MSRQNRPSAERARGDRSFPGAPKVADASALSAAGDVLRSPGIPLDAANRARAEARLGFDFSRVRIHDDAAAFDSTSRAHARAYTVGSHIAFGRGEYQPHTPAGQRLIFHELVHVAQQGRAADPAPRPRAVTQPEDPSEQQAAALASRDAGAPPPALTTTNGAVLARYPKEGEEQQRRESEALQRGQSPYDLGPPTLDPFQQTLRETLRNLPPSPPAPTRPGSWIQAEEAVPEFEPQELLGDPIIESRLQALAQATEDRERAAGKVTDTVDKLMARWRERLLGSVDYILFKRGGDHREAIVKALHAEERKLEKANPPDLVARVEALRLKARTDWLALVQQAVDRFVILAENDAQFMSVHQAAGPVRVFGLPDFMEKTVKPEDRPDVLETGPDSRPSAASVVRFMVEVQKESKIKAVAENYENHEKANPWVGDASQIGHYSFDVHLDGFVKKDANGFYDQGAVVDYLLAVDRAAKTTNIEWNAIYNDFTVAKTVNETLGKQHVGFSGGGGFPPLFPMGSFHHGPAPYVLHLHFNIMPLDLKDRFDKLMSLKKAAQRLVLPFMEFFNPPPKK
jgi:hypothetical protein